MKLITSIDKVPVLSQLSDDRPRPGRLFTTVEAEFSKRLAIVLARLPKYSRVRFMGAIYNKGVRTLGELCALTPRELRKWKHVGEKCVNDIVTALATFGLTLATSPSKSTPSTFQPSNLPTVIVRMDGKRPAVVSGADVNTSRPANPRIYLVVQRANGRRSTAEISGDRVNDDMQASAEDLLVTLTTGNRPTIKGLYDLCAQAFGTTREDAKKRITGASYGKRGKTIS